MWGCPMKKFSVLVALSVFCLGLVVGCDNSSSASDDNKESSAVESSSSVKSSSDDSVGSTIVSSNSAKNEQGNDSTEKNNSSNGKSSSGGSDKNKVGVSSSSTVNTTEPESSSSDVVAGSRCEKEGDSVYTQWGTVDKMYVVKCVDGRWKAVRYFRLDSSQVVQKTREEKEGLDSVFNPDVEYGEYEDIRDGHVYKTITFVATDKKKYEMFAENLNYGTFVKHDEDADVDVRKYCYDDDEWYCEHLGGLYTYSEALQVPRACDTVAYGEEGCPDESFSGGQGICPIGWKIANNDKFEDCFNAVGRGYVKSIMSKSGWMYSKDNTNSTGLSVYATGIYSAIRNQFENFHKCASFWDPTKRDGESGDKYFDKLFGRPTNGEASLCAFDKSSPTFNYEASAKADALAIRCVREIVE